MIDVLTVGALRALLEKRDGNERVCVGLLDRTGPAGMLPDAAGLAVCYAHPTVFSGAEDALRSDESSEVLVVVTNVACCTVRDVLARLRELPVRNNIDPADERLQGLNWAIEEIEKGSESARR